MAGGSAGVGLLSIIPPHHNFCLALLVDMMMRHMSAGCIKMPLFEGLSMPSMSWVPCLGTTVEIILVLIKVLIGLVGSISSNFRYG
jgi:hypothetical protein